MNKLKKNWKIIVIIILGLFGLAKCTQSCNRQTELDKANAQIEILDSTINALVTDTLAKAHEIDILNEKVNTANEKVNVANAKEETASAEADAAKARQQAAEAKAREEANKYNRKLNK